MARASIIITDKPNGGVDIVVDYGNGGKNTPFKYTTQAQRTIKALNFLIDRENLKLLEKGNEMPDISMCMSSECEKREQCYRSVAIPCEMQTYSAFEKHASFDKQKGCQFYVNADWKKGKRDERS